MGRPPTRPTRLRDGFYVEVRQKGANSGMKIWSPDKQSMLQMAEMYRHTRDVVVLGEHRKDQWVTENGDPVGGKRIAAKAKNIVATEPVKKEVMKKPAAQKTVVNKPAKKEAPKKVAKKPVKKPALKKVNKKKK
jgi:hypothetical protein